MENDVLRVKKGAEQDIRYYSNRKNRMPLSGTSKANKRTKGIFRGNRSLLYILLDIVLLIIVVILLNTFSLLSPEKKQVSGYSFVLQGDLFGDMVIAVVRTKKVSEETSFSSHDISVRFFLSDTTSEHEYFASNKLPLAMNESVNIRGYIPYTGDRQLLKAELYIGKLQVILTQTVKRD